MTFETNNYPVVENMRRIMLEKSIDDVMIAERIGCPVKEVQEWLKGMRLIRSRDVPAIAQALEVEPNDLYRR